MSSASKGNDLDFVERRDREATQSFYLADDLSLNEKATILGLWHHCMLALESLMVHTA